MHDLAWAAGFYEGEGSVRYEKGSVRLSVSQSQREPLDWFRDACDLEGARIYEDRSPSRLGSGRRPLYHLMSYRTSESLRVLRMLWPWLSARRRAQAHGVIVEWEARPLTAESRSDRVRRAWIVRKRRWGESGLRRA